MNNISGNNRGALANAIYYSEANVQSNLNSLFNIHDLCYIFLVAITIQNLQQIINIF